ncbi:unnamed protein product [Ixodes persulcatus]
MSSVLQPKKTNERLPQLYTQRATAALSSLSHICSRRRKLACAPPRVYKNRKILPSISIITSRSCGTRSLSLSLTSERHLRNFYPLARKEIKRDVARQQSS